MKHVDSATTLRPFASGLELWSSIQPGDLLFFEGRYLSSKGIQLVTGSPWSHVGKLWLVLGEWMILEAVSDDGVRFNPLAPYIGKYRGNIAVARRSGDDMVEHKRQMTRGLQVLDDSYNFGEEACMFAHRFLQCIPVKPSTKEFFCSGLMQYITMGGPNAIALAGGSPDLTPEQLWCDPSIQAIGALIKP